MNSTGNFRGTVVDGAVGVTTNGFAQAILKVHADEMYDEENKEWGKWEEFEWEPNEIDDRGATIYTCIFGSKGATFSVDEIKKIFSWDGTSLGALDSLMAEGVKVQWSNELDTYKGETKVKSDGIKEYDAPPGGTLKKLDAKGLAELDAKFSDMLKGETKPEKAAGGKRKSRKAAAKAEPKAPVEEEKTEEPKATKPKRGGRGKKKAADAAPPAETSAPPADPPEEEASVEEQADDVFGNNGPCTKDEAWADINSKKGDKVTDAEVASAWIESIQNVGEGKKQKELTDEEWGSVRAAVIDVVAVF